MNTSKMQYLNSVFILAALLCGAVTATPPGLAETCMTDDLMMVYEPIEPVRTHPKRAKKRATTAHVRLASEKNAKVAAVSNARVESSLFAPNKRQSEQATSPSNGSHSRQTARPIRVSSVGLNQVGRIADQKSLDLWNGTQISHVDVAER